MIYTYYNAVIELVGINNVIGGNVNGPISNIEFIEGFTNLPTEEQIQAKLKELQNEYEKQAYARSRAVAYDPISEQLDQIYHDMDGWKAKIKAVKDKYPKP
jgi:hypothetical protein